jgi:lipoprotein-anchoring transpeptidase ErfK/SrfK
VTRKIFMLLVIFIGAACGRDAPPRGDGLPYHYYLLSAASGDLRPGFGVAELDPVGGGIRTHSGRVVPLDHLEPAHAARALGSDRADLGWVVERSAGVWAHPDDGERPIFTRALFDRVRLASAEAPPGWISVESGFMRASELRVPTAPPARPVEAAPGERWIDVDTASQTLSVFDGDRARFVTLISTGQGRPGTRFATPRGVFRIDYKLPTATMDRLDEDPIYSFEEVPWVQYFHKEVALHGAYWHQRFGHAVSHGCVNLSPPDAERVFALTRASTPAYAGTIVRVR